MQKRRRTVSELYSLHPLPVPINVLVSWQFGQNGASPMRQFRQCGPLTHLRHQATTELLFSPSMASLRKYLSERGIILGGGDPTIRLVTHLDIGAGAVDQLATEINNFFS